jgi:hypothetical protein
MPSKHHSKNKAASETQNIVEPKTMMQIPNPKIAVNSFIPAFST